MTLPAPDTLEREKDKLYLTDAEIIRRLGVPERRARGVMAELEAKAGFPKKTRIWGADLRYWPKVKAWLDKYEGL